MIFLPISATMMRQAPHPVVRWAVHETVKLQYWMCFYCPGAPPPWCEQCLKQPKFNNARAFTVLNIVAREFFLPNLVISQVSGEWNIQTAKVQQRTCHYCAGRAHVLVQQKTAGWLADRCANDSRESRCECNFFAKFCCRGEVSDTWKKPKFNNARAIVLA